MRHILTILAALLLCDAPAQAQTLKALMYNTTNGQVLYTGTNSLRFVDSVSFSSDVFGFSFEAASGSNYTQLTPDGVEFSGAAQRATTRTNLGLGATWLTNTNVTNFRTAIGLGATNSVNFISVTIDGNLINGSGFFYSANINSGLNFEEQWLKDNNDQTVFDWGDTTLLTIGRPIAGLTNNGDIRINQTTPTNGLLFVYRTNNEPFLGLANLIASNNTTVSNETLFRVGVAEATNRSAQFGFRSTNTNGNGVAVFSVFGFNALMQIGADASTNAVIFSGGGTNNQVMTLIKNGATEFARPVAWNNTTNADATRINLGLPLSALTNTSNVTMMRALAGSTNTNHPFSGTFETTSGVDSFIVTVSNGIIVSVVEP